MEAHSAMQSQVSRPHATVGLPRTKTVLWRCAVTLVFLILLHHGVARASGNLSTTQTIQIASFGNGSSAAALRARIVDRLRKSRRLEVVENPAAADVVLRGTSSVWPTGTLSLNPHSRSTGQTAYQGYLSVELVNKSRQTLWSYLVTPSRFHTTTIENDLADQMVSHLLEAIHSGAVGSVSGVGTESGSHVALHGAGATFPEPIYRKWFQSSGMPVTYDAVGSEAGIQQLAAGKVDFAASDMPLAAGNSPAPLEVTHFPTVLGGVVPIYNLPSFSRTLNLTPEVLAGIYAGAIRKWNDPRILEANHGARLPNAAIAIIHRSDGSGTTYVWTSYLAQISPNWKASVGAGAEVAWPVGIGAAGNEGVAELVEKTPYAIGYVELTYAIQHRLNYAALRNPAGQFIKADLSSITAAATGAMPASGNGYRVSILDARNKDAYPISTFTWILVPREGLSAEKRSALVELLNWALTSGQKQCASLGYAPLPREVVSGELQEVKALESQGAGNR